MKAIELTGVVDAQGNLCLEKSLLPLDQGPVRVIVLYSQDFATEDAHDPDDTPLEEVKASLRRALEEARAGQRIPLSQMWDGIDD